MMDIAQSVASIDDEMAAALPQLGLGGGEGAYGLLPPRFGLARAAAALLPSEELCDEQVESVTSFEGIGALAEERERSAPSPVAEAEGHESSD